MHIENDLPYQRFQEVFEQYYNPLCNYAFSFVNDLSSSEDIVQETFVKIWEKKQDIITSEGVRFYLFTAVRNNCLTHLQKAKKVPVVELNDYDAADEQMPVNQVVKDETDYRSHLAAAMDQLPPKCREVFMLSRMSKQSYKEIADTLGVSIKTVENQIGKALKILRAYVKDRKMILLILIFLFYFLK